MRLSRWNSNGNTTDRRAIPCRLYTRASPRPPPSSPPSSSFRALSRFLSSSPPLPRARPFRRSHASRLLVSTGTAATRFLKLAPLNSVATTRRISLRGELARSPLFPLSLFYFSFHFILLREHSSRGDAYTARFYSLSPSLCARRVPSRHSFSLFTGYSEVFEFVLQRKPGWSRTASPRPTWSDGLSLSASREFDGYAQVTKSGPFIWILPSPTRERFSFFFLFLSIARSRSSSRVATGYINYIRVARGVEFFRLQ